MSANTISQLQLTPIRTPAIRPSWKVGFTRTSMDEGRAACPDDDERGDPPAAPFSRFRLCQLLWLHADLLEESQRVEVVAALLDLVALEGEEEGSGRLLALA